MQTHEFASGMTTNSQHFGPCLNPWNLDHVPGGSSGGSASAVAAGLAYMGTGSDTGGSIRIPAACCGIAGMKPTYGRVSRYGIIPMAWSLDHPGPLTRSVMDASLCLDAMSGDGRING
ncbi:amidase [Paenactinomyces guangxiensis]|uniref:amidase n=1 Tax=Paenactinomyces guangxiensis TaxID=1490290 RepID=UPI00286801D4|nr:amidase [Paenactinomyces guangxiensis]